MGRYKNSDLFHGTSGNRQTTLFQANYEGKLNNLSKKKIDKKVKKSKKKEPIFDKTGHVTIESISARREFFLGKSVAKIENVLQKNGYITQRRPSRRSTSHAKIIVILNQSKERNIQQVQVSPGSKRHGNVPYVKISTSDYGKIKIIGSSREQYKSDGKENATLLFRRKKK